MVCRIGRICIGDSLKRCVTIVCIGCIHHDVVCASYTTERPPCNPICNPNYSSVVRTEEQSLGDCCGEQTKFKPRVAFAKWAKLADTAVLKPF